MYVHVKNLQFESKPTKPDPLFAMKFQEVLGGQFGEMTVMMQYLWQGWTCRVPGKYKDMIQDIGAEEMGHVEMLTVMLARLLEGAPSEVTEKAVAANPALAAVIGGMNPQHAIVAGGGPMPTNSQGVPWQAGYIVASGNLLTDFRSNVSAEAQGRLQTSRIYTMTDDPGVKAMLKFNLARDTYHQQQWLLGIEQLIEDGYTDGIEDSNRDVEDPEQSRTFWSLSPDSRAGEGRWARGKSLVGDQDLRFQTEAESMAAASDDLGELPAPDPKLYATYDGNAGKGVTGDAKGVAVAPLASVVGKVKDALS